MLKDEIPERYSQLFRAMGHPARLKILKGLMDKGCCVNNMAKCLKLPQSNVSQHLSVLKAAKAIKGIRKGNSISYEIADKRLRAILKEIYS